MSGTENIIEKILSDARRKAKEIEETSQYDLSMKERADKDYIDAYLSKERATLKKEAKELVERRVTLAELDKRKLLLKTKQDAVDAVFDRALKKLSSLSKKDYLSLVEKLIERYAEKGDTVVLSRDKVLKADDIKKLKAVADKDLTVSGDEGDFTGGVMLIGKKCDKDLSFGALLGEERESQTAKITAELFG